MEVLYYIRPYFGGISPYIGLKNRPYIWNRYLHFRILKFPLKRNSDSILITSNNLIINIGAMILYTISLGLNCIILYLGPTNC